jgi:hypothetical protein
VAASTFNRKIFSTWSRGGQVWLAPADDAGRLSLTAAMMTRVTYSNYSSFTEPAVNKSAPNPVSDSSNNPIIYSTHKSVPLITADPERICDSTPAEDLVGPGVRYSRSAASEITKPEKCVPFVEQSSEAGQIYYCTCCKTAVTVLQNNHPAVNNLDQELPALQKFVGYHGDQSMVEIWIR